MTVTNTPASRCRAAITAYTEAMKARVTDTSRQHKAAAAAAGKLRLMVHAEAGHRYLPFLRRHLTAAHQLLHPSVCELSLALVGDARMSSLHKRFMNIDTPTDVLTFPLEFDARGRETAGEVIICVPEAARQARVRGTKIESELLLYAVHGLLHLSGFDDRTEAGFRQMHRKEDDILIRLGLGPVFGTANPPASRSLRGSPARSALRSSGKHTGEMSRRRRARATESLGV